MEDVLTQITDPNVAFETVTNRNIYLSNLKHVIKTVTNRNIYLSNLKHTYASTASRQILIDQIIEILEERGIVIRFARRLGINKRTTQRCWKRYQKHRDFPKKKSRNQMIEQQDYVSEQFMGFSISKAQLNHNLKDSMPITVKKPTFEPEARNFEINLQERCDWYISNWARAKIGEPARVKLPKTRSSSHTIISAISCSSVINVALNKLPPKNLCRRREK
ncbi:hypothetical protein F4703DRAFT_1905276 [Phycomyces blakesleeanus]